MLNILHYLCVSVVLVDLVLARGVWVSVRRARLTTVLYFHLILALNLALNKRLKEPGLPGRRIKRETINAGALQQGPAALFELPAATKMK